MFGDTVYVLTYPMTIERGKQVPDYTATPTAVAVSGVDVQPGAAPELQAADRREGAQVRWTVYLPGAASGLTAKSKVRWQGAVYEVDGEPQVWRGQLEYSSVSLVDWK